MTPTSVVFGFLFFNLTKFPLKIEEEEVKNKR